jgi:hypothetical protein
MLRVGAAKLHAITENQNFSLRRSAQINPAVVYHEHKMRLSAHILKVANSVSGEGNRARPKTVSHLVRLL